MNGKLIIIIGVLHVIALAGLARLLAPEAAAMVIARAGSAIEVTITAPAPEAEPRDAPLQPDAGAAAEEGREAIPREVIAPELPLPLASQSPAPRAISTGAATIAGASEQGDGTGAGGEGNGTGNGRSGFGRDGSGRDGSGRGGVLAAGPSVQSGELNEARDFPIPEGGRQARLGRSVTVHFTVTTDGRARDCSVANTQVDAATTALVCPLVIARIRFHPATRVDGTPVEASYGYRVDFRARL